MVVLMGGGMLVGSALGIFVIVWALGNRFAPDSLRRKLQSISRKVSSRFNPYIQITFYEFPDGLKRRSEAYTAVENYLSGNRFTAQAKRLSSSSSENNNLLLLTMDANEEVADDFASAKLVWSKIQDDDERSSAYRLTFHKKYRSVVIDSYLDHVIKEGKDIEMRKRQRKLFTNNSSAGGEGSHALFERLATFMDPTTEEEEITDDDDDLGNYREYCAAQIRKAWA